MNCKNKKIIIGFSTMIVLIVLVVLFFDLNLYLKAFLGTVVLGLLCLMRTLNSSVQVLENEIEKDEQVEDKLSSDTMDVLQPDTDVQAKSVAEDDTCNLSVSSAEFIKYVEEVTKSKH